MPTKSDIKWKDISPAPQGAQAETTPQTRNGQPKAADQSQRPRSRAVENSIAPALERPQKRDAAVTDKEPPNELKRGADPSSQAMPGHIATRYLRVENKYHFPNGGEPAFIDKATKLTTRLENTEVIADLVEIAKERGWTNIAIAGTKTFKAEAWQQANLAGLTVRGYRPSKLEEALLERRREGAAAGDSGRVSESTPNSRPTERVTNTPNPEALREGARQSEYPPAKGGVYSGTLVERGYANYRDDPREERSYYIKLQTGKDERQLWGKDLERAVNQSKSSVQIGDDVTVRFVGSEPVVVTRPVRNDAGKVVREERIQAHLNRWSVESTEFLRERAELAQAVRDTALTKDSAVRKYPSLAGTYTELRVAELKAIEQFKNPEDRSRFVVRTREQLAEDIERGEPLPVTRVKPRAQTQSSNSPKARDLVQERVLG